MNSLFQIVITHITSDNVLINVSLFVCLSGSKATNGFSKNIAIAVAMSAQHY